MNGNFQKLRYFLEQHTLEIDGTVELLTAYTDKRRQLIKKRQTPAISFFLPIFLKIRHTICSVYHNFPVFFYLYN